MRSISTAARKEVNIGAAGLVLALDLGMKEWPAGRIETR